MKYNSVQEAQADHVARYRSDGIRKGKGSRYSADYYRVAFIVDQVKGGRCLDVGCNSGVIGRALVNNGVYVNAVDIVPELVSKAQQNGIMAQVAPAENLPFEDELFDYVTCGEVLEHLFDPLLAIKEAYRVLKPGGEYIVSIPHPDSSTGGVGDYHQTVFSSETLDTLFHLVFKRGNVFLSLIPYIPEFCETNNIEKTRPQWYGLIAHK